MYKSRDFHDRLKEVYGQGGSAVGDRAQSRRVALGMVWRRAATSAGGGAGGARAGAVARGCVRVGRRIVLDRRRQAARVVSVACILLWGLSEPAPAFQFDSWISGMTLEQALTVAQALNVGFSPDCSGFGSPDTRYDHERATRRWGEEKDYCYATYILGYMSQLRLSFTPTSYRLHTLSIGWPVNSRKDQDVMMYKLHQMMTGKYGAARNCDQNTVGAMTFRYNNACWQTPEQDMIYLYRMSTGLRLAYFNQFWISRSEEEEYLIREMRFEDAKKRDEQKFR